MSGIEINKFAGAVLTAALLAMLIGMIGDALVHPKKHTATSVAVAPAAPSAREEKKEAPPIAPLLASASVDAGAKSASKCKTCHDLTNAKKAKIGPPLWDIVQADKAHTAGFSYSGPMKDAKGNWTYEDLNKFLFDPKGFVPGTKMVFLGVKSDKERADLIAFLRSLSDSPRPMP